MCWHNQIFHENKIKSHKDFCENITNLITCIVTLKFFLIFLIYKSVFLLKRSKINTYIHTLNKIYNYFNRTAKYIIIWMCLRHFSIKKANCVQNSEKSKKSSYIIHNFLVIPHFLIRILQEREFRNNWREICLFLARFLHNISLRHTHTKHTLSLSLSSPVHCCQCLSVENNAFFAWQKMPIYVPLFPSAQQR